MGRRYFCDFCEKQLPPGIIHRKNHNKTIQHMNRKRNYYEQFKEPIEILYDERMKRICNKWNQTGSCPYGDNCKYSHRSNYQLIQLIEQQKCQNRSNFDVNRWVKKKLSDEILLPQSFIS